MHGERVHPEMVEALGVPGRDMPGHTFVEAALAEETEGSGEPLFAM